MNSDPSLRAIFNEALDRPDAAERARYLNEACGADAALREQVEKLLRADDEAGGFFADQNSRVQSFPPETSTLICSPPVTEKAGDRIGRYKLLQQIGEGGCGVVYMAEQEEPVRRRVALKVIKLGMDTRQVIARFEAERQALALMDHPNIARVLDAGATDSGRPYFVMELVRGLKVSEFCDDKKLSTQERLDLFMQVCAAIQHAHQKGIIHRDLKPSNILVTMIDGAAVPKVIDFGIAKATNNQPLTDKTLFTAFEQFIGTPAYMSPEQAELSGVDVDTRTDIYSLGVVLYELLTGKPPFKSEELLRSGIEEMRRTIREREPPKPSTRLSTLASNEATTVAEARQAEMPSLVRIVRGDLDWIVMKCLEKDRNRRYDTVNALALDIRRHLNSEPIVARPPSNLYRFQKMVRRNKLGFAAASATLAALVLGVIASTWQAVRATRAEHQQVALRQLAEQSRTRESDQRLQAEETGRREAELRRQAEAQAYDADVNLAQQALAANNLGRAQALLYRHRPQPGRQDLRGWEWRYLWKQCQSDASFILCQKSNSIFSLSASPDGKWLAVGESQRGGLSVWDLQSRQEVERLPAGDGAVVTAFCPPDALLAFSMETKTTGGDRLHRVRLWNAAARQFVGESLALKTACAGLTFSSDGKRLITLTESAEPDWGEIGLWQIPEGKKLAGFPAEKVVDMVMPFPLAVSPDASLAAYRMPGGRLRLMDLALGKERWTSKTAFDPTALAFSPDGKLLASGAGFVQPAIHLWDVTAGKELRQLQDHRGFISSLVFWPDGKTLASGSADQTIRLWNTSDLNNVPPPRALRGHKLEIWRLLLLPDHTTLVSGSKDGAVCVWDSRTVPEEHTHLTLPGPLLNWRFASDSQSLLTLDWMGKCVRWDGADFRNSHLLADVGTKPVACFGDDGRWLAAGSPNGTIQLWDLQLGKATTQFVADHGKVVPRKLFAGGQRLAVYYERDHSTHEWDLATQRETQAWQEPARTTATAFSPDGRWCLAFGWGGASSLQDLAARQAINPKLEFSEAFGAAFSADCKLLAAASSLGFARVWQTGSWSGPGAAIEPLTLRGFLLGAHSVTFSPDSRRLAAGGDGREAIKLWDLRTGQELLTLEAPDSLFGHNGGTAFSDDGNLLGSLSFHGVLHLWRAPSPAEIEATEARKTP